MEFSPGASVYTTWDPEEDPARMRELRLEKCGLYNTTKAIELPEDQMLYPLPDGIPMQESQDSEKEK